MTTFAYGTLQQEVINQRRTIKEWSNHAAGLERTINQSAANYKALRSSYTELSRRFDINYNLLEKRQTQLKQAESEIRDLKGQLRAVQKDLRINLGRMEELAARETRQTQRISALEDKLESAETAMSDAAKAILQETVQPMPDQDNGPAMKRLAHQILTGQDKYTEKMAGNGFYSDNFVAKKVKGRPESPSWNGMNKKDIEALRAHMLGVFEYRMKLKHDVWFNAASLVDELKLIKTSDKPFNELPIETIARVEKREKRLEELHELYFEQIEAERAGETHYQPGMMAYLDERVPKLIEAQVTNLRTRDLGSIFPTESRFLDSAEMQVYETEDLREKRMKADWDNGMKYQAVQHSDGVRNAAGELLGPKNNPAEEPLKHINDPISETQPDLSLAVKSSP